MSKIKVFKSDFGICSFNVDKIVHIQIDSYHYKDESYKHTVIKIFLENGHSDDIKISYNLEDPEKEAEFFKNFNTLLNSNIDYLDLSDSDLCETILKGPDESIPQEKESIDDLVSNVKNIFKSCDVEVTLK